MFQEQRAYTLFLGVLGFTTSLNGLKKSQRLTSSAANIAARESTVTPLSLPLQRPADPMNRSEPARRAVTDLPFVV